MKSIIRLAISRPVSTLMVFLASVVLGLAALTQMKISYTPEAPQPKLLISCNYQGLPPSEVRELITLPLEEGLSSLKGLQRLKSWSKHGLAILQADLYWGTDLQTAGVEAKELIDLAFSKLPEGAEKPTVIPLSQAEFPSFWIGMFPKDGELLTARTLGQREILTRLQQTEGVGSITLIGGKKEEVKVTVNQDKIFVKGMNLGDLVSSIQESNVNFPIGTLRTELKDLTLKANAKAETLNDLGELLVKKQPTASGQPPAQAIPLKDLAAISFSPQIQESFFLEGDKEGVIFLVNRKPGESPLTVSGRLQTTLQELNRDWGRDFDFRLLRDESLQIGVALQDLLWAILIGAGIAFAVLFLFTKNGKSALILVSAIPVSALFAFLGLYLCGKSLNIMSLGGLALGLGMLVDNSIVVLENFQKRLRSTGHLQKDIAEATVEMAGSTIGSTITAVIVFLPIFFLPGIVGAVFGDLSLSVIFSMAASFFVSVTLVPVLFYFAIRRRPEAAIGKMTTTGDITEKTFSRIFRTGLRRPLFIWLPVLALGAFAGVSLLNVHKEFFNAVDQGEVRFVLHYPGGTPTEKMKQESQSLMTFFQGHPAISNILLFGGQEKNAVFFLANPEKLQTDVTGTFLLNPGFSAFRLKAQLEERFAGSGLAADFSVPPSPIENLLGISGDEGKYLLKTDSPEEAETLRAELKTQAGVKLLDPGPENLLQVTPQWEKMSAVGLSPAQVGQTLNAALDGIPASDFWKNGYPLEIKVAIDPVENRYLENLDFVRLPLPSGQSGVLKDFVTIAPVNELPVLYRIDKHDAVSLTVAPDQAGALQAQRPGLELKQKGFFAENLTMVISLLLFGIFFLYLYLVIQFESFLMPVLLLLTFPLSFAGLFGSLYLFGASLNFNSFFGILIILGSSVNVSIIMLENYRTLLHAGQRPLAVVFKGTRERVRPILITTITTIAGTLPVAIDPLMKSTQSGMALAIIGGHLVSTFLTLLVLPYLFLKVFKRRAG